MKSPRSHCNYSDRHLECQEALEATVISLIEQGTSAGRTVAEITTALIDLADHHLLVDAANRRVNEEIKEVLRRLGL